MRQLPAHYDPSALFEPDIMVGSQGQRKPPVLAEPELKLMAAIVQCALDDLTTHKTHEAGRPIPKQWVGQGGRKTLAIVTGPHNYFLSTDRAWPLSFENCCDHLRLNADDIRNRLRRKGLL